MSELVYADTLEEVSRVISENPKVLVEFGAEWCMPCKRFLPHFEKFASQHPEYVCVKVDIDVDSSVASTYNIQSVPTVMEFQGGDFWRYVTGRTVIQLNQEIAS